MLALDDPRWSSLTHAYGPAGNIPELLRTLAGSPEPAGRADAEPWFSLWSSLCHQGDVYTASYAAVPHLVRIAFDATDPVDFSFFQLPAAVELARESGRGPAIPEDLVGAYVRSISKLGESIRRHWEGQWDKPMLLSAITALAVVKGQLDVAEALLNLDDDWIARIRAADFD